MIKIGVTGCSNSSNLFGYPWHYYMGKKLNAEIISSSSPGAGNEMNFEKIKYILSNNKLDLFIVQVTEPSRLVMGLTNYKNEKIENNMMNDGTIFNNSYYYTFNSHYNELNLKNLFNKNFHVDDFIINHSILSDYNLKFKIFHTLLGIQQLCNFYNVKVIFFSWFTDLYELAKKSGYTEIIENMNIIKGCVSDIVIKNKIPCIPNDGHFDSLNSERIYEEYIHTEILKLI